MADELEKKPKPIGTPAPNYPKPKQESAPAPKQKLLPKQNQPFKSAKVKPGSPFKSESVPVGVQQTKHESPKHVEKRVNKMFKETDQPTLGIWNKNNTNPMAKPNGIRFNPKLDYKPSKEALEAANRKKIMNAGFAPKNWDGKSDVESVQNSTKEDMMDSLDTSKKYSSKELYHALQKVSPSDINDWNVAGIDTYGKNPMAHLEHKKTGKGYMFNIKTGELTEAEPNSFKKYLEAQPTSKKYPTEEAEKESQQPQKIKVSSYFDDKYRGLEDNEELDDIDKAAEWAWEKLQKGGPVDIGGVRISPDDIDWQSDYAWDDLFGKIYRGLNPNKDDGIEEINESDERSKASELYGTDLNKQQGYDYDRLSQELDSGDFVNLDANLVGSDYGYNNLNENQNVTADARKNPETGKYEVSIYPVSENGPLPGYEPEENEPTYEFDSFEDLKAFIENGYKESEEQQRAKASKLFGTDLNKR